MRRKTQKLLRRAQQLRDRTHVSGMGRTGPTLTFGAGDRDVLNDVFVQLRSKYVLHNEGQLEMAASVASSLQEIREIAVAARRQLPAGSDAHEPLKRIEAACATFIHRHPGIERRDFSEPVDGAELDDLFELRLEIAEAVGDVLDSDGLPAAQDLFNFIETDRAPETPWLSPGS